MSNSIKCPHCRQWIGPMAVHEDCARRTEERRASRTYVMSPREVDRLREWERANGIDAVTGEPK